MKARLVVAPLAAALVLMPVIAPGWSMKTHVWVGRQVLAEVQQSGAVVIAGKSYAVPTRVADALRSHPGAYLMGHLGPDAFPDPIVGQTTTHPGVDRGWATDGWLRHLIRNASTPEEIAFAYGFAGHAAGDVFAHTYVNAYAGSVFSLTDADSGRQVERRHFVLEKYIDSKLPPTSLDGLATATSFARDRLILDGEVFKQYGKVGTAHHLRAMHQVRDSVRDLDRETGKLVGKLTEWGAGFLKKQADLTIDAATAKQVLDTAQIALDAQKKSLELLIAAHDFAKQRLGEARDIVKRNPELITISENALIQQTKLAADALATATQVAAEVSRAISGLQSRLNDLRGDLGKLACSGLLVPALKKECEKLAGDLNGKISQVETAISGQRERQRVADEAARQAEDARASAKQALDGLKRALDDAVRGLADKSYEAAVAASDLEIKSQREIVAKAQQALDKAKEVQAAIAKELGKLTVIIDEIKKVADRYNALSLLTGKWLSDIEVGTEEYIKASHRAALQIAAGGGDPIGEYTKWFSCYGQVFVAVPKELGQVGCLVKDYVTAVRDSVDDAIDGLPEILRWLIFPSREVNKRVMREVKPKLDSAGKDITAFLTDPTTADFLWLLANPENATRGKLNSVFQEDKSRLRLITFSDVASMVDRDLELTGGTLDSKKFAPLRHSVTLAKLALLGPAELNELIFDLAGTRTSGKYGSPIYQAVDGNFSIMFDAVKNIDGNHQWGAYGLPYPRRSGVAHGSPSAGNYGHDFFVDPSKGMRIWTDRYLREKVFLRIFDAPVIGVLGERPELEWPRYKFPSCPANPFPSTQSDTGAIQSEDRLCIDALQPTRPAIDRPFQNEVEYGARYFSCDGSEPGTRFSSIVASSLSRLAAQRRAKQLADEFRDMRFEIHAPVRGSRYWAVMSARCSSLDRAQEAREVALSRGIATDAFLVKAGGRRNGVVA